MERYRNPVNGRLHREHTWCSLCEQSHATRDWHRRGWFCSAGCGGTALDALPWEFVRQVNPQYPERPMGGKHYLWHPHHPVKVAPTGEKSELDHEAAVLV